MRVRISYAVDLEDVPTECSRMLQDSLDSIVEVQRDIESLVDKIAISQIDEWQIKTSIEKCRTKLAKIDSVLSDNSAILEGYYAAKKTGEEDENVVSEG